MKVLHNLLLWSCDTFGDLFSGVVNRIAVTVVDTGFSSLLQKVLKEQPVDLSEGKKSINIRQTLEVMPNLCTISTSQFVLAWEVCAGEYVSSLSVAIMLTSFTDPLLIIREHSFSPISLYGFVLQPSSHLGRV